MSELSDERILQIINKQFFNINHHPDMTHLNYNLDGRVVEFKKKSNHSHSESTNQMWKTENGVDLYRILNTKDTEEEKLEIERIRKIRESNN